MVEARSRKRYPLSPANPVFAIGCVILIRGISIRYHLRSVFILSEDWSIRYPLSSKFVEICFESFFWSNQRVHSEIRSWVYTLWFSYVCFFCFVRVFDQTFPEFFFHRDFARVGFIWLFIFRRIEEEGKPKKLAIINCWNYFCPQPWFISEADFLLSLLWFAWTNVFDSFLQSYWLARFLEERSAPRFPFPFLNWISLSSFCSFVRTNVFDSIVIARINTFDFWGSLTKVRNTSIGNNG